MVFDPPNDLFKKNERDQTIDMIAYYCLKLVPRKPW